MRTAPRWITLGLVLTLPFASPAQEQVPVSLSLLVEALGEPLFKEASLTEFIQAIDQRGIDFDLHAQLPRLLEAAKKANRDPKLISTLVLAAEKACAECRSRFLTPLSQDELKKIIQLRFPEDAIQREVKTRGVTGMEVSYASVETLRSWGASDRLLAALIPDDQLPIETPEGYTVVNLKRAPEYDMNGTEGKLTIRVEMPPSSSSEFIMQHTGLFLKALSGAKPNVANATFTKPAPKNLAFEMIDISCNLNAPKLVACDANTEKKSKEPPLAQQRYVLPNAEGRNGFKIELANRDKKKAQMYEIQLKWVVRTTPRTPTPSLSAK